MNPSLTPLTAVLAVLIGGSIGLAGIGGVFLIPLLVFAQGLPIQEAIGTALVTFVFTGLVGTLLYARHGSVDWRLAVLTSAGSLVLGPLGARLSVALPGPVVQAIFAAFLLFVGVQTLARTLARRDSSIADRSPADFGSRVLLGCGALVGFGSGLTGVGGPAILVPLLVFLRLSARAAVGVSQVNQIAAAGSGAVGHLLFGQVDLGLAVVLTFFEVVGVYGGAQISRRAGPNGVRPVVATLSLVVAVWTIVRLL